MISDTINTIKNVFNGIGKFFLAKFMPSILIPIFEILFGMDNKAILQALLLLIVFDFITGVFAAWHSGETIKSRTAVRSAFKVAIYGLLFSAAHLCETITPGNTYIEEAMITFLGLTELISIIENVGKMGYAIPKKLLSRLQKFRDEDVSVHEKKTVKKTVNPKTQAVETHTIEEKKVETHVTEKPTP